MFITGLITGILVSGIVLMVVFRRMMFIESESKFDFAKTKDELTVQVQQNKWSMPNQYDLQQIMAKNGYKVKPVNVFSVCKPDIAARVLSDSTNQHISAIMPCRISVYEKADGKTYISRINTRLLSALSGRNAKSVIGDAGAGVEKIVQQIIKR